MNDAALGFQPLYCTVHLTNGADFYQELRTQDGTDWPAGAVITLQIGPSTTWAATITGPSAGWDVDKTTVAGLGFKTPLSVRVTYSDNSGADLTWFIGDVTWHG